MKRQSLSSFFKTSLSFLLSFCQSHLQISWKCYSPCRSIWSPDTIVYRIECSDSIRCSQPDCKCGTRLRFALADKKQPDRARRPSLYPRTEGACVKERADNLGIVSVVRSGIAQCKARTAKPNTVERTGRCSPARCIGTPKNSVHDMKYGHIWLCLVRMRRYVS